MVKRKIALAVLAGLCLLMPDCSRSQTSAPPPQNPIKLQQAIEFARIRNPTLLAAREHAAAVRANELTAGLRVNPTLTLAGQDVTLPANNPGNPYFYSANLSRLFERGEKRRWRLDSAHAGTDVSFNQLKDLERGIVLNVKTSFTQMLLAKEALALSKEALESYRKTVNLNKVRLDAGDISKTDFERIDLQLAQFESDYDNARLNLEQASAALQLLLGVEHFSPAFDITGTLEPPPFTTTIEELERDALSARPDYAAAQQTIRAAQANARLAIAMGSVDPTISSEYERSGRDNTFGVNLQIPLRIFDKNQGEKERTRYEVESANLSLIASRNQVLSDVDVAWKSLQIAQSQALRYKWHYLDEAAKIRDNLEFSYKNGSATLLDYLDALRDFRTVNANALNARAQVWLALHQLSYAAATEVVP